LGRADWSLVSLIVAARYHGSILLRSRGGKFMQLASHHNEGALDDGQFMAVSVLTASFNATEGKWQLMQ
jgi:hypothetical protein